MQYVRRYIPFICDVVKSFHPVTVGNVCLTCHVLLTYIFIRAHMVDSTLKS